MKISDENQITFEINKQKISEATTLQKLLTAVIKGNFNYDMKNLISDKNKQKHIDLINLIQQDVSDYQKFKVENIQKQK